VCGGDTGTVGENRAQMCVVVILEPCGKMEHCSVCWWYLDSWGKWSTTVCGGDTGKFGESGAQLCVVVIVGKLGTMEQSYVW